MYVSPNFPTKKALKQALQNGQDVFAFNPGLGGEVPDGRQCVEGPHYPRPHTWYASVQVQNGRVVKVIS